MTVAAKKSHLIEWLNELNDAKIINGLDQFRIAVSEKKLPATLSFEQLLADLETSEKDRKNSKFISLENIEKESKKW